MNLQRILLLHSIKGKITVGVTVFVFIVLSSIIITITIKLKRQAIENAQKMTVLESKEYAGRIMAEVDKALLANRTLAQTFGSMKRSNNVNRDIINSVLKQVLDESPTFLGTYTAWESNALDGRDSSFKDSPGHDSSGRLIPYWYRDGKSIKMDPIVGLESESTAAWYYEPRKTLKETVTDPFYYQGVYMVSFLAPVVDNNIFSGLTGIDLGMDFIQKLADGFNLYEGKSRLVILSQSGNLVAVGNNHAMAGKSLDTLYRQFPKEILTLGTEQIKIENDTIRTYMPMALGNSGKHWIILIETPINVLLAEANRMMWLIIAISLVCMVLLVMGLRFLIERFTNPVNLIAENALNISKGILQQASVASTSEEIVKLNSSFRELIHAQQDITQVCTAIAEGDFSRQAIVRSEGDQLSMAVNKMIENLKHAAVEDARRNWTTEGLAKFADILRSETNLSLLSEAIISNLVKYIKGNQGGIFILNDNNEKEKYLELVACYAFERKKYLQRQIEIGEGLVGQCFLEKATILLTEVPENYVTITSGLGDARPRCVVIVPLMINEVILGVLELASFKILEPFEVQFIEKLAESIASAISSVKINEKTRVLLEHSQQQTEEMRSQEEEMRQNMEELMATQEEIQRKEQSYRDEIASLKEELDEYRSGI